MSRRTPGRLDGPGWGLLLDRRRPVTFTFDGRPYHGFEGDVIASALYAEGRRLISRSLKYHRPRGVLTMAGHDANALVKVAHDPHVRADRFAISDGLAVRSINRLGFLDFDLLSALELFARFLPVGFYYKTFHRPRGAWRLYERLFRRVAGLGRLDPDAPSRYCDQTHLFADVLVVGAGPAGLSAAISAAEAGADTLLIDEWAELGGSLTYRRGEVDRGTTETLRTTLLDKAHALENLRILTNTAVTALFAGDTASAIGNQRLFKIRARETVLATGAYDQPLVFRNNDRPGIMFADAAQRLMRLYAVAPGRRAVVVTVNRFGYEAALDLVDAGVDVAAIVDLNVEASSPAARAVRSRGIRTILGSTVVEAMGLRSVCGVAIAKAMRDKGEDEEREWIACDLLLMSVGYAPALDLASHAGAKIVYDPAINMHRAAALPDGLSVAGSAAGVWSDDAVIVDGQSMGRRAAARALGRGPTADAARGTDPGALEITHAYPISANREGKDFVDFDEDVETRDIANAVNDGYDDMELLDQYARVGLGPSQGRHAHVNTLRIVATATGKTIGQIGATAFRSPLAAEKFSILSGRPFEPVRLSPMHARHVELGAQMMVVGPWLRPAYYGEKEDREHLIEAEVAAVRHDVGLVDISMLGGIEIRGPDAALFVDRIYTGTHATQSVGRARYALMVAERGLIMDDGLCCRLHERHLYLTTTAGAIDRVLHRMTGLNAQWKMEVDITDVTAAYAAVNLAGPKARELLRPLTAGIDVSKDRLPYMSVAAGTVGGIPVRILRAGFVGELSYEIRCPSQMGEALWDQLMAAGRPFGLRPIGADAEGVLRLEKGRLVVGQDTDALSHPGEVGLEWAVSKTKPFHIGKRSIEMHLSAGITRKLAGFALPRDSEVPSIKEGHLVIYEGRIAGRVTSVAKSQTLGRIVGLAYLPPDLATPGGRFEVRVESGALVEAEVVPTPFYDSENNRQEL